LREQVTGVDPVKWATPAAEMTAGEHGGEHGLVNRDGEPPQPGDKLYRADSGRMVQTALSTQVKMNWASPQVFDKLDVVRAPEERSDAANQGGCANLREQVTKNWPTPMQEDSQSPGNSEGGRKTLTGETRNWHTPRAIYGEHSEQPRLTLEGEAKQWPTTSARDVKGANNLSYAERGGGTKGEQLPNAIRHLTPQRELGQLNPQWESLLMGWPCVAMVRQKEPFFWDWTGLEPLPEVLRGRHWTELFPGFPAGQGPEQYDYEPPRTLPKGSLTYRTARVEMAGNGVVPWCAAAAYLLIYGEL
jgi:hypothetical protein